MIWDQQENHPEEDCRILHPTDFMLGKMDNHQLMLSVNSENHSS
jgi:hypothetical protein